MISMLVLAAGLENAGIFGDPLFVDSSGVGFCIHEGSPTLGFNNQKVVS